MIEKATNKIFESFLDLPYPGDKNITSDNSIESVYVGNYFRGKTWSQLNAQDLQADYPGDPSACLSFMTPEAFRYFFPGFMKISLLEYDIADAIFDVVINKLSTVATDLDSELRSVFEEYSHDHLEAIARFLILMSDKYCKYYPINAADLALNSYWEKYLPEGERDKARVAPISGA